MKKIALILAGGSGKRMMRDIPKQFIELSGRPVLMHTIEKFRHVCDEIMLVLPATQFDYWKKLCLMHQFNIPHVLVEGGDNRIQSVSNGLSIVKNESLIAIHDGVRPFIEESLIINAFEIAAKHGNAVLSVKLKDSIREVNQGKSVAKDRQNYVLIQTPQTFKSTTIKEAYKKLISENNETSLFTDDASVAEYYGEDINLVEGSYRNIKITIPEDLIIAEVLLKSS